MKLDNIINKIRQDFDLSKSGRYELDFGDFKIRLQEFEFLYENQYDIYSYFSSDSFEFKACAIVTELGKKEIYNRFLNPKCGSKYKSDIVLRPQNIMLKDAFIKDVTFDDRFNFSNDLYSFSMTLGVDYIEHIA